MDLRKLKTLIELVETSGIAELEIQEGEERVRITRSHGANATPMAAKRERASAACGRRVSRSCALASSPKMR